MFSKLSLRRSFKRIKIMFYLVFGFVLLTFLFVPTINTPMFAQQKKKDKKQEKKKDKKKVVIEDVEDIEDFSLEELLNVEITSAGRIGERISRFPKIFGKLKGKDLVFNNKLRNKYKNKKWKIHANLLINENRSIGIVKMITKLPEDLKNHIIRSCSKWKYIPAENSKLKGKFWISITFPIGFQ